MRVFVLLFLTILLSFGSFSAEIHISNRKEGTSILGSSFLIEDIDYGNLNLPGVLSDEDAMGFVRFGLGQTSLSSFYSGDVDFVINFSVTTYDNSGGVLLTTPHRLKVNYVLGDMRSIRMDELRLAGVHKFVLHVTGLSAVNALDGSTESIASQLYLECGFSSNRTYPLDVTTVPIISTNLISFDVDGETTVYGSSITTSGTDEIELVWNYIDGAEEYDLEWTWVDNYSETGIGSKRLASDIRMSEQEFLRNSSRVRLSGQSFRLPQIFSRGYLVYRVRGVGRWLDDSDLDKYGSWSKSGSVLLRVSNWDFLEITQEHEENLNWQYQATYAEDGKKKEVTQYFDGSLRGRQTVTRINSDNNAIVGETIYDNQGRGVIQILPTPINNPGIKYYPGINKSSGLPFDHTNFDWEDTNTVSCAIFPSDRLSDESGASQYYSDTHTENNWQQYVADAEGYPYTQVQYTPDNTGRIRKQSGVGSDYKLSSGKETEYFYAQPYQEELNRLFGYKVGYKKRYKKNMVVDANEQVSVSYLDAQGRVVATALSGDNTTSFSSLESESNPSAHGLLSIDLLGKQNDLDVDTGLDDNDLFSTGVFSELTDGLSLNTQVAVVQDGSSYDFNYTASIGYYSHINDCDNVSSTGYPFVYDLDISLKDDCGNFIIDISEDGELGEENIGGTSVIDYNTGTITRVLDQGSYTLSKQIRVNEAVLDRYVADYLENNVCVLTETDFSSNPALDCSTDCDECVEELGTLSNYLSLYGNVTAAEEESYTNEYETLLAECRAPCEVFTMCDASLGMLEMDMSPNGQYGLISTTSVGSGSVVTSSAPLSIFNTGNNLPNGGSWANPSTVYLDSYGNVSLVENSAGDLVPPEDLTLTEFIENWEPSWSSSLVSYHPEYDLYVYEEELCAVPYSISLGFSNSVDFTSSEFESYVLNDVNTYAEASGSNIYNLDLTSEGFFGSPVSPTEEVIYASDPFFHLDYGVQTINGVDYSGLSRDLMEEKISNYQGGNSMLTYSYLTATSGTGLSNAGLNQLITWSILDNMPEELQDAVWVQYKNNYFGQRAKINQLLRDFYGFSQTPGIYNNCIGEGGYSFGSLVNFSYSTHYPDIVDGFYDLEPFLNPSNLDEFSFALCSEAYDDKQMRIMRTDALIGGSGDDLTDVENAQSAVNYGVWEQTGLCPLTLDAEYLLNKLATADLFTSVTNSSDLPELTNALYTAIGGTFPFGVTVSLGGVVNGSGGLDLMVNEGSSNSLGLLTLPQIGDFSWSTYGDWHIYEVSSSFPSSATTTQILVRAGITDLDTEEYVIEYTSSANFDGCQVDNASNNQNSSDCNKKEELESDLLSLLNYLTDNDLLATESSLSGVPSYVNSALSYNIGDDLSLGIWDGTSTSGTIKDATGTTLFSISYEPGVLEFLTFSINTDNGTYASAFLSGDQPDNISSGDFVGSLSRTVNGLEESLDFNCECSELSGADDSADYAQALEDLINYLTDLSYDNILPSALSNASTLPMLADIGLALGVDDLVLTPSYSIGSFSSEGNNCETDIYYSPRQESNEEYPGLRLISGISFDLIDNREGKREVLCSVSVGFEVDFEEELGGLVHTYSINNLTFTDTGIAYTVIADNYDVSLDCELIPLGQTIGSGSAAMSCLPVVECEECDVTQLQAPLSCTDKYVDYKSYLTNNITEDGFPISSESLILSEDYFCDFELGYITEAYLAYLTGLNVSDASELHFLSIQEFGSTPIGYNTSNMLTAVNDYVAYVNGLSGGSIPVLWNDYVTTSYMDSLSMCPTSGPSISLPELTVEYPCDQWESLSDSVNAQNQYDIYIDQVTQTFKQAYIEEAMSSLVETFKQENLSKEYHYTLYYYDRSGNLVQTVPPKGVDRLDGYDADLNASINAKRLSSPTASDLGLAPNHSFNTVYKYNSLNQLVRQTTPDGGESRFGYDKLGRLVVSQNAKQLSENQFSYTRYDELGRVVEVGELRVGSGFSISDLGRLEQNGSEFDVNASNFPNNLSMNREEVVHTLYDDFTQVVPGGIGAPVGLSSYLTVSVLNSGNVAAEDMFTDYHFDNARNRINAVVYQENYSMGISNYESATLYNYDVHGNVEELIQVISDPSLESLGQSFKSIEYDYDLVSGNVNEVIYQRDASDEFRHKYCYDSDNRITNVLTSKDGVVYEQDAKYFYYEHGPLARTELGDYKVQAQDYAYTIQGWLKSVNGEDLDSSKSMGFDGLSNTVNNHFGKDSYGYSLSYYDGDYKSTNTSMIGLSEGYSNSVVEESFYNGNIRGMSVAMVDKQERSLGTTRYNYGYDQLNRIKSMNGRKLQASNGGVVSSASNGYSSSYGYDANGNLEDLTRYALSETGESVLMDELSYTYAPGNNQLLHVKDGANNSGVFDGDLESQSDNNYSYDAIGQLQRDTEEEISSIEWKVNNKVKSINRVSGSLKPNLSFVYDGMGNRITKVISDPGAVAAKKLFYFRDAQGNVMATYQFKEESSESNLYLEDYDLYGSSRIGQQKVNEIIASSKPSLIDIDTNTHEKVGDKYFELSNHLGNVLQVITDRSLPENTNNDGITDYYSANVLSCSDYYPFGMQMFGGVLEGAIMDESGVYSASDYVSYTSDDYRYGFNGKEKDDEVKGEGNSVNYKYRMHDPRIGRFFAVDKLEVSTPYISPYNFCKNSPIHFREYAGLIWVNPYSSAIKKELKNEKPDYKKIEQWKKLAHDTKVLIQELKKNDPELFSYIENLTYEERPVGVFVFLSKDNKGDGGCLGVTNFSIVQREDGTYRIKGLDKGNNIAGGVKARTQTSTINITIYSTENPTPEYPLDEVLANEVGDVMNVYENPKLSYDETKQGNAEGWKYEDYNRTQYSFVVEEIYRLRKNGEKLVDDAYPLNIVTPAEVYTTKVNSEGTGSKFTINN